MTASAHMAGYNRACVHTDQPSCGVVTRAQLETAIYNADHDPNRDTIIINDLWLTTDDIRNILVEMWGYNT